MLDTCVIAELLPIELSRSLISLPEAIHTLHRPPADIQLADLEQGSTRSTASDHGRVAGS